jgi:hypothetical protein
MRVSSWAERSRHPAQELADIGAGDQAWTGLHRHPCSAASQPQREAQAHAGVATSVVDGVASPWQPQRQPSPGQATHWHEKVEAMFMNLS